MRTSMLTVLAVMTTMMATAMDLPPVPFVLASGYVDGELKPNTVSIRFELKVFDKKSDAGLNAFAEKSKELESIFAASKLPARNLEAYNLYKGMVRENEDKYGQEGKIIGYVFSRDYMIQLDDLSKYPGLLTKLFSTDGVHSIHSSFGSTLREKHEEELIKEAMLKARKKAETLAKIAGSEVTGVYAISETDFVMVGAKFLKNDFGDGDAYSMDSGSRKLEDLIIIPSKIDTSASINVIYKIK